MSVGSVAKESRAAAAVMVALLVAAGCGDPAPSGDGREEPARKGMRGMMERMGPGMMGRDGGRMSRLPEGVGSGDLPSPDSRGAELAVRFCSSCHGIPSPARLSRPEWRPVLDRMFRRLDRMSQMPRMGRRMMDVVAPTTEERRLLRAYYTRYALAEADPSTLPALEGRDTFGQACSRCHALPDPGAHRPGEWPGVVRRMRGHMGRTEGIEDLSDDEAGEVVRYLKRAAARAFDSTTVR